jgi:hypothetical protein
MVNSPAESLDLKDEYYAFDTEWESQEYHHVELHRGLKARHITMIGRSWLFIYGNN